MKNLISVLCLLLFVATSVDGSTYTSTQSGFWDDVNTWSGNLAVPGPDDTIIIMSFHHIEKEGLGDFTFSGKLTVETDASLGFLSYSSVQLIDDGKVNVKGDLNIPALIPLVAYETTSLQIESAGQINFGSGKFSGDFIFEVLDNGNVHFTSASFTNNTQLVLNIGSLLTIDENLSLAGAGKLTVNSGATLEIGGDLILSESAYLEMESGVCISVGDDLVLSGSLANIDGAGSLSIGADEVENTMNLDNGATLDNVQNTVDIYAGPGASCGTTCPTCRTVASGQRQGTLPVELVYFEVSESVCSNNLYWSTETETNNAFFMIERSEDAKNFVEIGKVLGAGTTQLKQFYSFEHDLYSEAVQATGLYYRLKQVDQNGDFEYSEIVYAKFNCQLNGEETFSNIFPNPTLNDFITLKFNNKQGIEKTDIIIYNSIGQKVITQSASLFIGLNDVQINLSGLPAGIYWVHTNIKGAKTLKLTKL